MRQIIFILSLFIGGLSAQPIGVTSLTPIPSNPSPTDSVFVAITVTTGSQGHTISVSHTLSGTVVDIEGCYYSGMLPAVDFHYDTISLGILPSGVYTVNMNALVSFDANACVPADSSQLSTTFTVGTPPPAPPCCIDILGVNIIPALPNDTTDIHAEVGIELPALGFLLTDAVNISGNDVTIDLCYYADSIPNTNSTLDTFALGTLPAGQYNLTVHAVQSDDPLACNGIDTATFSTLFTVDSTNDGLHIHRVNDVVWNVYPNPTSDQFVLEGVPFQSDIQLIDLNGKVLWQGTSDGSRMTINVQNYPAGIYILNVSGVTKRVKVVTD
ncbi:MAG: T9SS type A sorting domain-containing protein [Cryomorphaceae bacterium]|nr:T9SS type A sorting domain-containing protein [Cryomorphaceae bacterium]